MQRLPSAQPLRRNPTKSHQLPGADGVSTFDDPGEVMNQPQEHQKFSIWRRPFSCGKTRSQASVSRDRAEIQCAMAEFKGSIDVLPGFPESPALLRPHKGPQESFAERRHDTFPRGWCKAADAARIIGVSRRRFRELVVAGVCPPAQGLNVAGHKIKVWRKLDIMKITQTARPSNEHGSESAARHL